MATKKNFTLFKDKPNNVTDNEQFNNLSLNTNHPFSSGAFSGRSKSVTEKRKILDYVGSVKRGIKQIRRTAAPTKLSDFANDSQTKKESHSWNKSTKNLLSKFANKGSGKDKLKKEKALNASTLSLYIEAFENSNEANLSDVKDLKRNDLIRKGLNAIQIDFNSTAVIQNLFEFPRQEENDEAVNPEVAQFRVSQKLLNNNLQLDQTFVQQPLPLAELSVSLLVSTFAIAAQKDGSNKTQMGLGRFVDFTLGQRIICKSEKYPNRCSIWRFEKFLEDDILAYRCSTCQADINDLKEAFGVNYFAKVPVLRVKEDGRLLEDPDTVHGHICKWETCDSVEEGRVHAQRLIIEILMDLKMPFDENELRQKLKEAKRDEIFAYMDPEQKTKAADIFRGFSLNSANKWTEWIGNSMEVSPITIAQREETPRPSLSRWQSTLSLFSPNRKKTHGSVTSLFTNLFKTPK